MKDYRGVTHYLGSILGQIQVQDVEPFNLNMTRTTWGKYMADWVDDIIQHEGGARPMHSFGVALPITRVVAPGSYYGEPRYGYPRQFYGGYAPQPLYDGYWPQVDGSRYVPQYR